MLIKIDLMLFFFFFKRKFLVIGVLYFVNCNCIFFFKNILVKYLNVKNIKSKMDFLGLIYYIYVVYNFLIKNESKIYLDNIVFKGFYD